MSMEDKALQKALSETPLFFDRVYYLKRYPDARVAPESALEHFCRVGIEEQRSPSIWFDPKYYLEANPDVKESGANPILHYLEYGQYERRATN
ncbi:MAG: hypothetical protein U9N39_07225, partial [Campylobacterota bacterium]|nr:hypothetical protein [Campylobacterota bacterium]